MTATTKNQPAGPAAAAFKELAAIAEAQVNLDKRLGTLHGELREVGWRGRPAVAPIPGLANGDAGVAPYGKIGALLREIPRVRANAARQGGNPDADVATIAAELAPLEARSEELRSEIRTLVAERQRLPAQRVSVARRYRSQLAEHARHVASSGAAHANQLIEGARQVLEHRGQVYAAMQLAQSGGKPAAMPDAQWLEISREVVASLVPWTDANQPALVELWKAIERVAGAGSFATTELIESEAA